MKKEPQLKRKIRQVNLELEPITWLRIRTCAAIFGWGVKIRDGKKERDPKIPHAARLLEKMIREEKRDCVIGKNFLYFFNGEKLTHVIQKMTLLDVEETDFDKKLYQYRKTDGKKGKDQHIKFKEFQRGGKKYHWIDKDLLEDGQVYYLAENLGEHDCLSKQRQFYYTNGRLFEIYDLKDGHFCVRARFIILENEKKELERLRDIPGIRKRLEKNEKVSKSVKVAKRPAKERGIIDKLEQILTLLPLNKSPLEIIGRLSKEKMQEIVANRHRLDDCWIDGKLDRASAFALAMRLEVITGEDEDLTETIGSTSSEKIEDGQQIDEGLSKAKKPNSLSLETGLDREIWKLVERGEVNEDEAKRIDRELRMRNE